MDRHKRNRMIGWGIVALIIIAPVIVTVIGAVTSPPTGNIPVGHVVYIEADQPSEKTTMLRGLFIVDPSGASHLLTHETEPQDVDAGSREWITEPAISPDGSQAAFIKQIITLQEGQHSIVNQIWLVKLNGNTVPMLQYNLTLNRITPPPSRIVWSKDGKSLLFISYKDCYQLDLTSLRLTKPSVRFGEYKQTVDVPLMELIGTTKDNSPICLVKTDNTLQYDNVLMPNVAAASADPTGRYIAYALVSDKRHIVIKALEKNVPDITIPIVYGWSLLGSRKITSVRWSPDSRFIGYTVSKPPGADDELFITSIETHLTIKLPFRAGQVRWDWGL